MKHKHFEFHTGNVYEAQTFLCFIQAGGRPELGAGRPELGAGTKGDLGRFEFPAFPEVVGDV